MELIIVIAIIGIVAAIAVPKFGGIQQDAKIKADIASAKVIADATYALIAREGITKSSYADLSKLGDEIKSYLAVTPKVKGVSPAEFYVKIESNDDVKVSVHTDTDDFILYPNPDPNYLEPGSDSEPIE